MNIPKDPVMLLSYINTQLRDNYKNLSDLCASLNISEKELTEDLSKINYIYNPTLNRFEAL